MERQQIFLTEIALNGKEITLRNPLKLSITFNRHTHKFLIENTRLNIFTISSDTHEGISDLKEQIEMLWSAYVEERPENLTEDAKKFSNQMKRLLKPEEGV